MARKKTVKKTTKKKTVAKKKPARKVAKKATPVKAKKKAAPKRKTAAKRPAAKKTSVKKPAVAKARSWKPTTNINKPTEDMMAQGKAQYDQFAQEAANQGREGFEAFTKSMNIWAKGSEEIMRASMALAQNAAEKQAEFIKQAMASKSINDLADLQNKQAQKNYDELVAEATKISELSVKTLTECAEPLNAQINKAVQKASEAMAA